MTEQRKKYLDNISYEEKIIRGLINRCEDGISSDRQSISFNVDELKHKKSIRKLKIIIKALKKQLPAPKIECSENYEHWMVCGVCKKRIYPSYKYCGHCGQKLR